MAATLAVCTYEWRHPDLFFAVARHPQEPVAMTFACTVSARGKRSVFGSGAASSARCAVLSCVARRRRLVRPETERCAPSHPSFHLFRPSYGGSTAVHGCRAPPMLANHMTRSLAAHACFPHACARAHDSPPPCAQVSASGYARQLTSFSQKP